MPHLARVLLFRPRGVVVALALAAAWGTARGEPLPVVVSLPPQLWLVEAVGGEHVVAVALIDPGDSPETSQPTDAEVSRALSARVYFRLGVPFERGAWLGALASSERLEIVDLRDGVDLLTIAAGADHPLDRVAGPPGSSALTDPHTWLSPRRLAVQARNVAATLGGLDPAHSEVYDRRLRTVLQLLDDLDRELAALLEPHAGQPFFVLHPAWGYFAADYGLHQVAIEAAGQEPSDRELTRLQASARAAGVRAVFVQPQVAARPARAFARAIGAELVVLDPLATDLPGNLRAVGERLAASFRR